MKIWINGRSRKSLDCNDRGLHYGDGVFETLAVRKGKVRLLDYHLERLFTGCARLGIAPPSSRQLRTEIAHAAQASRHATLKLIVTRGAGARGYAPRGLTGTTRILFRYPQSGGATATPAGVRLRICRTLISINPSLAGIKSLNRLESVMARNEWRGSAFADGLMLDADGHIVCGTMSNVFVRKGRTVFTPKLDRCGVHGVMRRWVLKTAPSLGFKVRETRIRLAGLREAEEIFITNALIGIRSATSIARLAWRARGTPAADALRDRLDKL